MSADCFVAHQTLELSTTVNEDKVTKRHLLCANFVLLTDCGVQSQIDTFCMARFGGKTYRWWTLIVDTFQDGERMKFFLAEQLYFIHSPLKRSSPEGSNRRTCSSFDMVREFHLN